MYFETYKSTLVLIFFTVVFAEALWALWRKRQAFHGKEALTNFSIFSGYKVTNVFSTAWLVAVLSCML